MGTYNDVMITAYSARFDSTLAFRASSPRTQARKGSDVPYIVHPVHVATILMRHGFDEDVVIAGLLHDTVEDTDATIGDVREKFGEGVASLVAGVTEKKEESGGAKRPWRTRKEEQLAHLAHGGRQCAALKAADALHNASATLADVTRDAGAWGRFNASPAESIWYYRELARLCAGQLGADHALVRELAATVEALAATV